jgi:hypothetical protein
MTSLITHPVKLIPAAVFLFDRISLYFLMVTHLPFSSYNRDHSVSPPPPPFHFLMTAAETVLKTSHYFLSDASVLTAVCTNSGSQAEQRTSPCSDNGPGHTTTCTVNPREHNAPLFRALPSCSPLELLDRARSKCQIVVGLPFHFS